MPPTIGLLPGGAKPWTRSRLTILIVPRKTKPPLQNPTARRVVRVCSEGRRGQQEIADALGMAPGAIRHALDSLLAANALHTNSVPATGQAVTPGRGDLYWADEAQVQAAELAARAGHDEGRVIEGDLLLIVRGGGVASLTSAMRPTLTAAATRWATRLLGGEALWLLVIGPDRDLLLVDQLVAAVNGAGGEVEVLSAEKLLDSAALRAYLKATSAPPSPAPQP